MFQNQFIALVLCFAPMLINLEAHQLSGEKLKTVKDTYAGRGNKLSIQTARSRLGCNKRCTSTELCNAVNFGNRTCELLTLSDDFEDHLQSRPGWTLSYKKNTCLSRPCENGGTCYDSTEEYICTCPAGYEGVHCQDGDECFSNPCVNGGTCTDGSNQFTCQCEPGYEGTNCEIDIDECETHVCRNGGTCLDGLNSATCDCPSNFTLDDCSIHYQAQFGTSYYIVVGMDFWTNAIDMCSIYSTHLAEIGSQEESDFFHQFIIALRDSYGLNNFDIWIGGTYMNGDFVWNTNNQTFDAYSNWASDEPANLQDGYCVYRNDASGQWRSTSCTDTLPFICELHYDG